MLSMINKSQLKKLNDNKLLKLTRRAYQMYEEDLVSDIALHYFINEVSARHYGYDDVDNTTWVGEVLCFSDDGRELVKIVKMDTAIKFIKNGKGGDSILPLSSIRSIQNDDKGNLLIFA